VTQSKHLPIHIEKSKVKPIYKKGMKEDANNYRPVTLVPALSEILEKVIANHLVSFYTNTTYLINFSLDL
jgi:hypothetical protein